MADAKKLNGVGGWLAFFVATLGAVLPLTTFLNASLVLRSDGAGFDMSRVALMKASVWSMVAIACLLCWYCCYRFFRMHDRMTVRIAIGTLIYLAALPGILEPLAMTFILPMRFAFVIDMFSFHNVRPYIYPAMSIAYLLRSRRVANTYRPRAEIDAERLAGLFD